MEPEHVAPAETTRLGIVEVCMSRSFFSFVVICGVGLSALLHTSPAAAEKSKWWPTSKSGSANNRGMSSSNNSSKGFVTKKFQGLTSQSAHMTGGANSLNSKGLTLGTQRNKPFKFKDPINLGGSNGFQNGSDPANDGLVPYTPPDFGPRGNARPKLPVFDSSKIADALKDSKLQPMQPGFGLDGIAGGAGNGPGSNGDAADPGQGGNGQA